ncbi:hypothetical protein HMPREF9431_00576 [Segatella oulorum F0390]|uniref:Uncharacterized protein n=1 Tax=Segatella oulorum F0390 TaxID=702438 RepID=G1W9S5_9BACT|nr:hypothetical protein HMPREF9431_00576 [Segatella oulorum F0390]
MLNIILRACTNHVQALNFCFIMCSLKSSNTLFKDLSLLLPHRGYTFDSAGLASATQPTLGNDVRGEATPLGVVLFLIAHYHHMRRMNDFPACKLILKSTMPMA